MAGENVIIQTLIQAGLDLNKKDLARVRKQLSELGGDLGLPNLEAQAKKLGELGARVQRERHLLERAATRGFDPSTLTPNGQKELTGAFGRAKAYQTQLNKLLNSLDGLATGSAKPLFGDLTSLQKELNSLGAITRNVAPLIDGITDSYKKNLAAARKVQQEEAKLARRREAQAIRANVIGRTRRVDALKNEQGRKAFFTGARTDFSSLSSKEAAKAASAFATTELKTRRQIEALLTDRFGKDSAEAKRAARDVDFAAQAYGRLKDRVKELDQVEALRRKNKVKADKLQRVESQVAQDRKNLGRKDRVGRRAFEKLGDSTTNVKDLATAKAAQRFAEGELKSLTALQKARADAFGATSKQAKAASAEVSRHNSLLGRLQERIVALSATEQKRDTKLQAQQRIAESQERRRIAALRQPVGKKGLETAAGDFSGIADARLLRRAKTFATGELRELQAQQQAVNKAFGSGSREYKEATEKVEQYARAIAALEHRLDQLQAKAGGVVRKARARGQVGSSIYEQGRKIYQDARLADGGLEALEPDQAKDAKRFVQARLTEVRSRGKELARLYGENSREAIAAGNAARKYAHDLDALSEASRRAADGTNVFTGALRTFVKYAVVYQVLYSLAAAFGALIRSVVELQTELLEIQAVTGSTDAQMGRLSDTVLGVARNSKFSLIELTKAAKVLAQAGVAVEDMNTTLRATADFAAATGSNLEIAADLISTTRSVFKELSDDVIANQLAKAINVSKLTGEDLKTILSLGAQTAKSFNLTSEQFLAAVAALRNAGLKASTVATGLRQGMLEIFSPDTKLTKALQERYRALGEDIGAEAVRARFFAFTKGRAPLLAALTELKRLGFADEGSLTLSRAFDIRSSNAIKAMVRNLEEIAANESRITFGRGAAEGAATVIDGLNASYTRLLSTISGFTYSRSEGILGFFTEVIQSIDRSLQKFDEYDLARQARGERPIFSTGETAKTLAEVAVGPTGASIIGALYRNTIGRVVGNEQTGEEATDQANAQEKQLAKQREKFDEYEKAARAYDISAAQVGEAVGETAEALVTASRTADDLAVATKDVFGKDTGLQTDALAAVAKSYADLAPTQRKARLAELKKDFPELAKRSDVELDKALFRLSELGSETQGALKGFTEGLNQKLVRSHEIIREMKGRAPISLEEFEAVVFQQIVARDETLQEVLRGTSQEAVDMQLGIIQQSSQALSTALREKGQANFIDGEAQRQAAAFIQRVKAIALTTDKGTADADIRAAVTVLLANFKDLDEATLSRLGNIQTAIFDAANQLKGGQLQKLLLFALGDIQGTVDKKTKSLAQETADRSKVGQEQTNPTLQDPGFLKYLEKTYPVNVVGLESIKAFAKPGSAGIPLEEFQRNSNLAQDANKYTQEYLDIQQRQNQINEGVDKDLARKLGLEAGINKAQETYDEARTNKQFTEARAALGQLYGAQIALEQETLQEAKDKYAIERSKDPDKNRSLEEAVLRSKQRLNDLQEKSAREREKLDREEAKVDNRRRGSELKSKEKSQLAVLDNSTNRTPQSIIDNALKDLKQVRQGLLENFIERKQLEGEINDQARAEIEQRKKQLRDYEETAAFLELNMRHEREARQELVDQLEVPITTGNTLRDARLEERGLVPGDREDRRGYLTNRTALLSNLAQSSQTSLDKAQSKVDQLLPLSVANPDDEEIAKKLRLARAEVVALTRETRDWNHELGATQLELERVNHGLNSGLREALNTDTILRALEQSESSFEHFGDVINEQVIGAIEGIGDAFADSLLEGEDFFQSMDKLFAQLGRDALRTVVKTLSNEALGSLGGMLLGDKKKGNEGLLPSLGRTLFGGERAGTTEDPEQPQSLLQSVSAALFGRNDQEQNKDECCVPPEAVDGLKKVAGGPGLDEVAKTEGKGFFDTVTGWFGGLIDSIGGGFNKIFGGIGQLFGGKGGGGGGGGGLGLVGAFTNLLGVFKTGSKPAYKGAQGFAGGGVFRGPGSGTSDDIRTFLEGPGGRKQPIRVANGESILTAKATDVLGEDFVHAANRGDFVQARNKAAAADQGSLSRASGSAAKASRAARQAGSSQTTQLNVTPAQMRMRLGDWLEQHVLEELSKR